MPYSTIPITSGSAKFSTLDPDADLFLEENNITVGANPENPATLYDYSTSTLNISHIVGNNGEVNLNNSDLIGIKRFICQDYLGAIIGSSSDTVQFSFDVDSDITYDGTIDGSRTKVFRIPSNIEPGSTVKIRANIHTTDALGRVLIMEFDSDLNVIDNHVYAYGSVSGYVDAVITVSGGKYYGIVVATYAAGNYIGAGTVSCMMDYTAKAAAIWSTKD